MERQITSAACGHILTNVNVWSPDSQWIVYDIRSDAAGEVFDSSRIERVNIHTGATQILYESTRGAHCGVVSHNPVREQVVCILGPEDPTPDWSYCAFNRRGLVVDIGRAGVARSLDARNTSSPFTPGALRGGTHLHVFDGSGRWIVFTYEDAVLSSFGQETPDQEMNLRSVGVSVPGHPVRVPDNASRNYDGEYLSVLVTRLHGNPAPGSDQIKRASEEAWIGTDGYLHADGTRQKHAIAFQGVVLNHAKEPIPELFVVDLPDDLSQPGDDPLEGTPTRRPAPPAGCTQRRLTFTTDRKYPGVQKPRHWPRSSPDGSAIAFLMKDDAGIMQLFLISPNGGDPSQLTHNRLSVASAFTWSPDGRQIACVIDNSIFVTDVATGDSRRLTPRSADDEAPRPEACVFSPDGRSIAYVRRILRHNQIFILTIENFL